jgi:hypothetical protein
MLKPKPGEALDPVMDNSTGLPLTNEDSQAIAKLLRDLDNKVCQAIMEEVSRAQN